MEKLSLLGSVITIKKMVAECDAKGSPCPIDKRVIEAAFAAGRACNSLVAADENNALQHFVAVKDMVQIERAEAAALERSIDVPFVAPTFPANHTPIISAAGNQKLIALSSEFIRHSTKLVARSEEMTNMDRVIKITESDRAKLLKLGTRDDMVARKPEIDQRVEMMDAFINQGRSERASFDRQTKKLKMELGSVKKQIEMLARGGGEE